MEEPERTATEAIINSDYCYCFLFVIASYLCFTVQVLHIPFTFSFAFKDLQS